MEFKLLAADLLIKGNTSAYRLTGTNLTLKTLRSQEQIEHYYSFFDEKTTKIEVVSYLIQ